MPNFKHNQAAIMKLIFEQAKPLTGDYSKLKDDYIDRLFRNEVSQPGLDVKTLTSNLYSSTTSIKPNSSYNAVKTFQPFYDKPQGSYSHKKNY